MIQTLKDGGNNPVSQEFMNKYFVWPWRKNNTNKMPEGLLSYMKCPDNDDSIPPEE